VTLAEIRQKYPQYDQISDGDLADRIYRKFYAGKMDRSTFDRKVGLTDASYTNQSGQNVFDVQAAGQSTIPENSNIQYVGGPMDWVMQSLASGASKAARGIASAPADVLGYDQLGREIRHAIPKVEGGQTGTDTAGTVLQYAVPAVGAFNGLRAATAAANAPKWMQYLSGLGGAAASDAAVTNPDNAATIGDIAGGPTAINPQDTSLEKRAKVGVETIPLGPLSDAGGAMVGGILSRLVNSRVGQALSDSTRREILSRSPIGRKLARELRKAVGESGENPDVVAKRLEEAAARAQGPEAAGFRPTTGTASNNYGLLAYERGVSSQPRMIQRSEANREALTRAALDSMQTSGDPQDAVKFFMEQYHGPTRKAEDALRDVQNRLAEAQDELGLSVSGARQTATSAEAARASSQLDQATRNQLTALTAKKNELFDAIDPGNAKPIDQQGFDATVQDVLNPTSRGDLSSIPSDIANRIDELSTQGDVTYQELNDMRPRVSAAIRQAIESGDGATAQKLGKLHDFMNQQADHLASTGDKAASDALDFYRNEFAPRFGQGQGAQYRKAVNAFRQKPSQTARDFLMGPQEGAQQLNQIIRGSPDAQAAQAAVQDFMTSQLARRLATISGDRSAARVADRFIRDYATTLDQFPQLRKELQTTARDLTGKTEKVSNLTRAVKSKQEGLKLTKQEADQSAARYFIGTDPDKAIERVFGSSEPARAMAELRQKATGHPEAMKGLRASVKNYLEGRLMNPSAGEDVTATVNRVNKAFNNNRLMKALRKVYTPGEISRLKAVQNRLNEMARIDKRVTSNSITNQLGQDSQKVRVVLASIYGIVKGRGVFAISKWLGNMVRGESIQKAASRIVQDSMLDPELAATMLRKDSPQTRRELRTYLLNNYPDMFNGNQDQSK